MYDFFINCAEQFFAGSCYDSIYVRYQFTPHSIVCSLCLSYHGLQSFTSQLECVSRGSVQAAHSIVSTDLFARTVDLLQRAVQDPKYLEKRQPKLNKLKEILSDHFGRHGRAGSSTRALVFSQLRSTVHEIKTEISDVPGKFVQMCFI